MARGFVQNGANVWIVGRRRDVLLEAVEAVRAEEEEAEAAAGAGEGSIHAYVRCLSPLTKPSMFLRPAETGN